MGQSPVVKASMHEECLSVLCAGTQPPAMYRGGLVLHLRLAAIHTAERMALAKAACLCEYQEEAGTL